jgi:hypothetical protein
MLVNLVSLIAMGSNLCFYRQGCKIVAEVRRKRRKEIGWDLKEDE